MTEPRTTALRPLPPPDTAPLPPLPGAVERAGGTELFVRRGPQAAGRPTAVFVHGLGGASTNWTDLMHVLGDRVNGLAPDLPGFGCSPPPDGRDYALRTHVRAVERLLDRLAEEGSGPVHLFGNSLGGAVATRVAARRPELVRTLTLVSPALPDLRPREGTDWRLGVLLVPGLAEVASGWLGRQPARSRARAIIRLCFADPGRVPTERFEEAVAEVERRRGLAWHDESLVRSLRGLIATGFEHGKRSLWRQAATVTAPTLLIWGKHDRLVHPAVGARAVRTFPRARLLVFEHCGHVAQMEDPLAVAAAWLELADGPAPEPPAAPRSGAPRGRVADGAPVSVRGASS